MHGKRLISLFLSGLIWVGALRAQTKYLLSDSAHVVYFPADDPEFIDSLVFLHDRERFCQCDDAEVYYDASMKHLAYKSFQRNDSCFTYDYWRNGNLKKLNVYRKLEDDVPVWWYWEAWCSNGQVIYRGPSPNQEDKFHVVYYYCNGNKMLEYDYHTRGIEGKFTEWYENGQVMTEGFFKNQEYHGEWKTYRSDGRPSSVELFHDGMLKQRIDFD